MNTFTKTLSCLTGLLVLAVGSSCTQTQVPEPAPVVVQPDGYELFVKAHPKYPNTMVIYRNAELMSQATPDSPIYICLSQQRGRLYVNGKVAADWPVSTGTGSRPTPTGTFRVLEKKREYSSNTWGKVLDANGRCVNGNADSRRCSIPAGGRFVGSPMPNWQRLTGSGIGMHTGKVRAGRTLSHGCIRTPGRMARELFDITATGRSKVTVTREVESCYPTFVGTTEEQAVRSVVVVEGPPQPDGTSEQGQSPSRNSSESGVTVHRSPYFD